MLRFIYVKDTNKTFFTTLHKVNKLYADTTIKELVFTIKSDFEWTVKDLENNYEKVEGKKL